MKGRRLAVAVVVCLLAGDTTAQRGAGVLAAEQWRSDLQFLVQQITTRDPAPFHAIAMAELDREVAALSQRVGSRRARPHQILVDLTRIAALVGDGHTRLSLGAAGHILLIELEWLDGEWRVLRTIARLRPALGARLSAIDDTPLSTAYVRVRSGVPQLG